MNRPAMDGDGGSAPLGEVPIEERLLFGLGDPPAYLRRGLSVEDAETRVLKKCESDRSTMLYAVRLRLRLWNRLLQDHPRVGESISQTAKDYTSGIDALVFGLN